LEEFGKKINLIQSDLDSLTLKENELDNAIEFAKTLFVLVEPTLLNDNLVEDGKKLQASLDIIDCTACGQPIPTKIYARHITQCFHKSIVNINKITGEGDQVVICDTYDAKTDSYCQRPLLSCILHSASKTEQDLLCGYPTSDFASGYCERIKKACTKHINWETLQKANLAQERNRLNSLLKSIQSEEQTIRQRIARRTTQETQTNITIVEN